MLRLKASRDSSASPLDPGQRASQSQQRVTEYSYCITCLPLYGTHKEIAPRISFHIKKTKFIVERQKKSKLSKIETYYNTCELRQLACVQKL